MYKSSEVRQDVSQECKFIEDEHLLLRHEEIEFKFSSSFSWKTWETSGYSMEEVGLVGV
jgi:hypothetical protein